MSDRPRHCLCAALYTLASARAVNIPPRVVAARKIGGDAPVARSFLTVHRTAGNVVLSALKKAEDRSTIVVRLFNPDDVDAELRIATTAPIAAAYVVNFLEERQEQLAADGDGVGVRVKPHQIRTIELEAIP